MIHQCQDGGNILVHPSTETVITVTRVIHQDSGTTRISGSFCYTCANETVFTVQIYQAGEITGTPVWQSPDYPSPGIGKTAMVPVDYHDASGYLASAAGGQYCITVVNDNGGPLGDTSSVDWFCIHTETIP